MLLIDIFTTNLSLSNEQDCCTLILIQAQNEMYKSQRFILSWIMLIVPWFFMYLKEKGVEAFFHISKHTKHILS